MRNKLIRLVELIQEDFPEDLLEAFKSTKKHSLAIQLALLSAARDSHQKRSETLWLQAGKQRTAEEKRASAQADLAAFVCAYLTGDVKEYAATGIEALQTLGRHGELDLVRSLLLR